MPWTERLRDDHCHAMTDHRALRVPEQPLRRRIPRSDLRGGVDRHDRFPADAKVFAARLLSMIASFTIPDLTALKSHGYTAILLRPRMYHSLKPGRHGELHTAGRPRARMSSAWAWSFGRNRRYAPDPISRNQIFRSLP
jgi:hypothetical protein